ncbi:NAD-dependent epimerase/dehydratase family protein [Usitatibacter palustris]|uniref:NAD-dependent epimerase/dehydratase domain-containing protein n=1 Tax=Usitatibacter palustris TaxID=2732487 RepID=A0A6M4H6I6_9PROT|nr:NAD-dependent epimerase/dehydratase family protein [Usitatibacter palustris]QJR15249.1 hypothetical protein DSM104440_02066 [Usitatibacter palustris]
MRLLVIGGTGSFTARVTELATQRGHEVMIVTRGRRAFAVPLTVRALVAERSELRSHATELAAFAPEAVVDSICFEPERADDLVALFPAVKRVVLVSTVDVYGEDVGGMPVTEERVPAPVTPYATQKLACERIVLAGLGARATVVRPEHILGRTYLTASLWGRSPYVVDRIRKGKPVPIIDGGRNLITPVYALDIAHWVLATLENPLADGEVFNVVGGETITLRAYYECIARTLGTELRLVAIPSQVFARHVPAPTQFSVHRPFSCGKAMGRLRHRAIGTPQSMLDETVRYMLERGLVKDCAEHPIDDQVVDLALRHEDEWGRLLHGRPQ